MPARTYRVEVEVVVGVLLVRCRRLERIVWRAIRNNLGCRSAGNDDVVPVLRIGVRETGIGSRRDCQRVVAEEIVVYLDAVAVVVERDGVVENVVEDGV